jgi:osmotically-inducible protein OsmY
MERLVATRSDSDIQRHIEAELFGCPDVDETDIAIKVSHGIVSLSGFVRHFFDKYGAEDAVKRVAGVVAVVNGLEVQREVGKETADPQIARAAVAAIRQALPSCGQQVRPIVRHGSVTLEGELERIEQRDLAGAVVRGLRGVACVVNAIALKRGVETASLETVRRAVEESLKHCPQLDASGITVDASANVITLRGQVKSWAERSAAERCARSAAGRCELRNDLIAQADCAS